MYMIDEVVIAIITYVVNNIEDLSTQDTTGVFVEEDSFKVHKDNLIPMSIDIYPQIFRVLENVVFNTEFSRKVTWDSVNLFLIVAK